MSVDGRFVAFESAADNLVDDDTNGSIDIFVHDMQTGVTTRVSVDASGNQADGASNISSQIYGNPFSADGGFIAFASQADNLVGGDNNNSFDIFRTSRFPHQGILVRDDGVTTSTSGDTTNLFVTLGTQPTADVTIALSVSNPAAATLSANSLTFTAQNWDEQQVVVVTGLSDHTATNDVVYSVEFGNALSDDPTYSDFATPSIAMVNLDKQVTLVTQNSAGAAGELSNLQGYKKSSDAAAFSADGRYIAFDSVADNLVSGDSNAHSDVFLYDIQTGTTTLVSVDSNGVQGNGDSFHASVSADGHFVAFGSRASNLVAGDTNNQEDIFLHDVETGVTSLISVDSAGTPSPSQSDSPSISADGRFVAFSSFAKLAPENVFGSGAIYLRDTLLGTTSLVSVDPAGVQGDDESDSPVISADGRFVAFFSFADNMVPGGDTNGKFADVFLRDTQLGVTTLISVNSSGAQSDGQSFNPSISADGRFVAFSSQSDNLTPNDANNAFDVFLHDTQTGITSLVSVDSNGVQGNSNSTNPSISADGRYISFVSNADNLTDADSNGSPDVFLYDTLTGITTRLSVDSSGRQVSDGGFAPKLNSNATRVVFASDSEDLLETPHVDATGALYDIDEFFLAPTGVTR